jgi:quercetin dioxygenase-like cupin family protein
MESTENRLREAPAERFAAPEHLFDLNALGEQLRGEPRGARDGHRQMTIYRHGAVTMVLFDFEAGGQLHDHKANGLVTIHALQGALSVRTPQETYELASGVLVVLKPGIPHSVQAREAARMLLTVHLEGGKEDRDAT